MAVADPQKDLVLPPGRYVFIQNDKGLLDVWVGPTRVVSSSSNEVPLTWNPTTKRFDSHEGDPKLAVRSLIQVAKDEYVILEGMPILKQGDQEHPLVGQSGRSVDIDVAERTTLHGPQVFALWPRQAATVVAGHRLAYDQYLLVRVHDDRQTKKMPDPALPQNEELMMGDLFVIKGTDTSFYMPGPGIEVVKDEEGNYVRNAVTVEPLEYAYLRDLNGEKEYVRGPAVVYPRPTQTFVTRTLSDATIVRRFRALELTETSALYVKVTQTYTEEEGPDAGEKREVGEELFLRGKDYPLYYPRKEHMLIRQGDSEIHYAIAIPRGSGYYVRNKRAWEEDATRPHLDGEVELVKGPKTLLIDPRNQTLVTRAVPLDKIALMYPGNQEAATINQQRLRANAERAGIGVVPTAALYLEAATMQKSSGVNRIVAGRQFEGDVSNRPNNYTKPHSIDLDSSKYDGALRVAIDPGYAVLLINSVGHRRVVQDGEVALLEYDEFPRVLRFSTGTPKSGNERRSDVYLRTVTKISDQIHLETSDGVKLTLELSYRIRFQGDPTKWFDIEDPVGFMTDNLRSRVHHAVGKLGIREFYADFAGKVRSTVLGEPLEGKRQGFTFEENGLHIYDVDVLKLNFEDRSLEGLFAEAAKDAFKGDLQISKGERDLGLATALTAINLAKAKLAADGAVELAVLSAKKADADAEAAIAVILAEAKRRYEADKATLLSVQADGLQETAILANEKLRSDQEHAISVVTRDEEIRMMEAVTKAVTDKMASIQPGLIQALMLLGETEVIGKLSENFNVQSIIGGTSISEALQKTFAGTRFANLLEQTNHTGNGQSYPVAPAAHARRD